MVRNERRTFLVCVMEYLLSEQILLYTLLSKEKDKVVVCPSIQLVHMRMFFLSVPLPPHAQFRDEEDSRSPWWQWWGAGVKINMTE